MKLGHALLRKPAKVLLRKNKSATKSLTIATKRDGTLPHSLSPVLKTFTIQPGKRPYLGMAKNTFARAANFDQPLPEFQQYR